MATAQFIHHATQFLDSSGHFFAKLQEGIVLFLKAMSMIQFLHITEQFLHITVQFLDVAIQFPEAVNQQGHLRSLLDKKSLSRGCVVTPTLSLIFLWNGIRTKARASATIMATTKTLARAVETLVTTAPSPDVLAMEVIVERVSIV